MKEIKFVVIRTEQGLVIERCPFPERSLFAIIGGWGDQQKPGVPIGTVTIESHGGEPLEILEVATTFMRNQKFAAAGR